MTRRAFLLFERLVRLPWWLGIVAAAIAYTIFTLVFPIQQQGEDALRIGLRTAAALLAWLAAVLFTVVALFSLARARLSKGMHPPARDTAWIRALSWEQFSKLIGDYWRGRGFETLESPDPLEDDVTLVLLRNRQRHLVRYRNWRSLIVGAGPVRDLFSDMRAQDASRAFLITAGQFNEEALEFAEDKPIELIDGLELAEMLEEVRRRERGSDAASEPDSTSAPRRCA